jgi:DNA-binding MarR family transcriptional regulator
MRTAPHRSDNNPPPSDDVFVAMESLRRLVRALRVFSHTTKADLQVSGAQLYVLQALDDEPGMSLKALAQRTLTDPSSVSVVVSRLVDVGMIRRFTAEDDARRSELELSARGRALLRKAPRAVQARMADGLRALPARELRAVSRGLAKLAAHLGVHREPSTMFFEPEPRARAGKSRRRVAS